MFIGNLKQKIANYFFYQQNGFIQEQLRTAVQDMQLWGTTCKSSKTKERKLLQRRRKSWEGLLKTTS